MKRVKCIPSKQMFMYCWIPYENLWPLIVAIISFIPKYLSPHCFDRVRQKGYKLLLSPAKRLSHPSGARGRFPALHMCITLYCVVNNTHPPRECTSVFGYRSTYFLSSSPADNVRRSVNSPKPIVKTISRRLECRFQVKLLNQLTRLLTGQINYF